jgi:hypothetical protein
MDLGSWKEKKMSLFEQLANAKEQGRGRKITEPELGQTLSYVVQIDRHEIRESNRGLGTLFIVEFTIREGTAAVREGERYSWVQVPGGQWGETARANIKNYAKALLDREPTAQDFEDITKNQHVGTLLDLEVEHRQSQSSGRSYYVHMWRTHRGPDIEEHIPAVPSTTLTKDEWLAGAGEGTPHPANGQYEWCPSHPEWGVRPASK